MQNQIEELMTALAKSSNLSVRTQSFARMRGVIGLSVPAMLYMLRNKQLDTAIDEAMK